MPIVLAGAKIVSEEILKAADGSRIPWAENGTVTEKKSNSPLDKVQPLFGLLHLFILAFLCAIPMLYFTNFESQNWKLPEVGNDW